MASHNEEKMTKFLDFPFDAFLMVRLEYSLLFEDELEAKLLRIIERYVCEERSRIYRDTVNKHGSTQCVSDITRDIWVPISYALFMSDLYNKVTSENTIKKALNSLIEKKIIFKRHERKKRYDPPEYKIHHSVLQMLLTLLRDPEYQKLIPSIFEALKSLPSQELTPSECQELIPSNSVLSLNPESRVSKNDTNYKNSKNKGKKVLTDLPSISLSPEIQSFYDLWSQMPFNAITPKVTQTLIDHCAKLAPHIQTLEQLSSLAVFAREYDHVPAGKDVKLGNLVNALNGWLQVQSQSSQPPRNSMSKLRDLRSLGHGGN